MATGGGLWLMVPRAGPAVILTLEVVGALAFVVAVPGLALLRRRIEKFGTHLLAQEKSQNTLAAEVEAQALLVRQMSIDLEELRKRLTEPNPPVQPSAPLWEMADLPVNLNRRGQIIRLSRKGKSVSEIASDLHIGQGEVELLLKVHDLGQAKSGMTENVP